MCEKFTFMSFSIAGRKKYIYKKKKKVTGFHKKKKILSESAFAYKAFTTIIANHNVKCNDTI